MAIKRETSRSVKHTVTDTLMIKRGTSRSVKHTTTDTLATKRATSRSVKQTATGPLATKRGTSRSHTTTDTLAIKRATSRSVKYTATGPLATKGTPVLMLSSPCEGKEAACSNPYRVRRVAFIDMLRYLPPLTPIQHVGITITLTLTLTLTMTLTPTLIHHRGILKAISRQQKSRGDEG